MPKPSPIAATIARKVREKKAAAKKTTPKRRVNGSQKGASFEREISKRLSLWLSRGENPDLFWRSSGSGSRSTGRVKATGKGIEFQASDIAAIHPEAMAFAKRYTIECKFYRDVAVHQLIYTADHGLIATWWEQACRDANSVLRQPILIFKGNRTPAMICMGQGIDIGHCPDFTAHRLYMVMWPLDDFLSLVDPDDILPRPPIRKRPCTPR